MNRASARSRSRGFRFARSATLFSSGDMSTDVVAPAMFPLRGSYQHGPPLLPRVRPSTVPRARRSDAALRLPSVLRPGLRSPSSLAYLSGDAGISQVPGPSSSSVPWSTTPPGAPPSCAVAQGDASAFEGSYSLGSRNERIFGALSPRPARSLAYASPVSSPIPSQG